MKKTLLALGMAFAATFAMSAAEESYTITFKNGDNNTGAAITTSTAIADLTNPAATELSAVSSATKSSLGLYGLKVGENKNPGNITFAVAADAQVTPTKVEIQVSTNKKNGSGLVFKFNDMQGTLAANQNDAYATCTFNNFTSDLTSIKLERATSTAEGFIYVKSITVYYEAGAAATVSAPAFKLVETAEGYAVEMTTKTEGAEIRYTKAEAWDAAPADPTAESTLYTAPVDVWMSTNFKAVAIKDGELSNVAAFEANPPMILESFDDLFYLDESAAGAEIVTLNATVVKQHGKYLLLRKGNRNVAVYGTLTETFNPGDVINRLKATIGFYGGIIQLTNPVFGTVTPAAEAPAVAEGTIAEVIENNLYNYFAIAGATISGGDNKGNYTITVGDEKVALRNNFNGKNYDDYIPVTEGSNYTVTGYVGKNNGTMQFCIMEEPVKVAAAVEAPVLEMAAGSESAYAVKMTTTTEGAKIYYTTDGTTPDAKSYLYEEPVDVWMATTFKAIAIKGEDVSSVTTFEANPPMQIDDFSILLDPDAVTEETATGMKVRVNDVTVVAQHGLYLLLSTSNYGMTTNMLVYGTSDRTFTRGQKISSLEATIGFYGKLVQLTKPVFGDVTDGEATEVPQGFIDQIATNNIYGYFTINGVTISDYDELGNYTITTEDGEAQLRNNFYNSNAIGHFTVTEGKNYSITGYVSTYNGKPQFTVMEEPVKDTAALEAPVIKMVRGAEGYEVEMTTETEGAEIRYTTNGTTPTAESTLYTAPVQVWESTVFQAITIKDGVASEVTSFEAVPPFVIDSFSMLLDADESFNGMKIEIDNVTVLAQRGRYLLLSSGSGYMASNMLVFGTLTEKFTSGDVISTLSADIDFYGGVCQLTKPVFGTVTPAAEATVAEEGFIDDVASYNLYKYFTINDVTISDVEGINYYTITTTDGVATMRNNFFDTSFDDYIDVKEGAGYSITGYVSKNNDEVYFYLMDTPAKEGEEPIEENVATFDFTDISTLTPAVAEPEVGAGTNVSDVAFTNNGISLSTSKGTSTDARIWKLSGGDTQYRIYKGATMTIACEPQLSILSVEMTGASNLTAILYNEEAISTNGTQASWTATESTKEVKFTVSTAGNPYIKTVKVVFKNTSGVAGIELDNEAEAEFYNLQGVRVEGDLTPGLYIRRQGNKATKVLVK